MSDDRRAVLLREMRSHGIVGRALAAAGVTRDELRAWREDDPAFAQAMDDAEQDAIDAAEYELRQRAVVGLQKPVIFQGQPVYRHDPRTGELLLDDDFEPIPYTVPEKSDSLLIKYMEAKRPDSYGKQRVETSGSLGVNVRSKLPLEDLDPEERAFLRRMLEKRERRVIEGGELKTVE